MPLSNPPYQLLNGAASATLDTGGTLTASLGMSGTSGTFNNLFAGGMDVSATINNISASLFTSGGTGFNSLVLVSPNSSTFKITVDNSGVLSITQF